MNGHIYSVEELLMDDSFVNWCLSGNQKASSHWVTIIQDNQEQAEIFKEAKELIKLLHGGLSENEIHRQIEIVRLQLNKRKDTEEISDVQIQHEDSPSSNFHITPKGKIKRNVFKLAAVPVAAACLLLIVAGIFFFRAKPISQSAYDFLQPLEFKGLMGQRRYITLSDGSQVILKSNSSITIGSSFNKSRRAVKLRGDAYFKVAENHEKPFIVFTGGISTSALGTSFYIHNKFNEGEGIAINLLNGKVKVENEDKKSFDKEIILLPGESAESTDGVRLTKTKFDQAALRNWIKGSISFDKTPIPEAIQQLENWYGVEIKLNKEGLKNRMISGIYDNEPLEQLLKVICFSINRNFHISGNTFIIE